MASGNGGICYRGYTGHEHLTEFELINMNGRMYDPVLGRFLSPDNYVQMPDNTQNYNRYSYCLNNPLRYTDPSGNWFGLDDLIVWGQAAITYVWEFDKAIVKTTESFIDKAFTKGGLDPFLLWNNTNAWKETWAEFDPTANTYAGKAWRNFDPTTNGNITNNAIKIAVGYYLSIPIWETQQAILGNIAANTRNLNGDVDEVWFYKGSVVVNDNKPDSREKWGFTLGPYINSQNIEKGDDMLRHEYGHTIQSRILGPLYLWKVAIPSGYSELTNTQEFHNNTWYETWANKLAGVPESDKYPRSPVSNKWYWWLYVINFPIPIFF